jgi:NAD-reducing hydrogenase small subunit
MSFQDLDEWLIDLSERVEVVFSPLADIKHYPEQVDVVLAEGAIANHEHLEMIARVRQRSRLLLALGDCAVTGNVTALRNPLGGAEVVLQSVYLDHGDLHARIPDEHGIVPRLVDRVVPVHAVVPVDVFIPGCPPPAPRIRAVLEQLLAGEMPRMDSREMLKFG